LIRVLYRALKTFNFSYIWFYDVSNRTNLVLFDVPHWGTSISIWGIPARLTIKGLKYESLADNNNSQYPVYN